MGDKNDTVWSYQSHHYILWLHNTYSCIIELLLLLLSYWVQVTIVHVHTVHYDLILPFWQFTVWVTLSLNTVGIIVDILHRPYHTNNKHTITNYLKLAFKDSARLLLHVHVQCTYICKYKLCIYNVHVHDIQWNLSTHSETKTHL